MVIKAGLTVVILLFTIHLIGQTNSQNNSIENGIVLCLRGDTGENAKFDIKGYGVEIGYYIFKRFAKKSSLNLDLRLAYSSSERYYNAIKSDDSFIVFDTIRLQREGIVDYDNIAISLPLRYRFFFKETSPIFLMAGFNVNLNVYNSSLWRFDEIEYDRINDVVVSEKKKQEEDLNQDFISTDFPLLGIGYKKEKVMFDLYFSGGSLSFDNDYIRGFDKISIVFNVNYRIN